MTADDALTLTVAGRAYGGWMGVTVTRGIDRMCAEFSLSVAEIWSGQAVPWQIAPWSAAQIRVGSDLLLTGIVYGYKPRVDGASHQVSVPGRSLTSALVDCALDLPAGQFSGYTLEAIVRGVCGKFGIDVVVQTDASAVVADATWQRAETCYAFLERLCRLAGVLMTDDAQGRLVLTTAGAARSSGTLIYGQTIETAEAEIDVSRRYSQYIVHGQAGLIAGGGTVQTNVRAVATDPGVPLYRPHVSIAESQLTASGMQLRANWERNYAYGRSTRATIGVLGWRQPDGRLWQINEVIAVDCAPLAIDRDLLIVSTQFTIDARRGRMTMLTVAPPEGYTPDPGEVRVRRHGRHGRGKRGASWTMDGKVTP